MEPPRANESVPVTPPIGDGVTSGSVVEMSNPLWVVETSPYLPSGLDHKSIAHHLRKDPVRYYHHKAGELCEQGLDVVLLVDEGVDRGNILDSIDSKYNLGKSPKGAIFVAEDEATRTLMAFTPKTRLKPAKEVMPQFLLTQENYFTTICREQQQGICQLS